MPHQTRLRAAFEANKADQDIPDDPIARIDALTKNARNTWLVLLGALAFVGLTLMGVEHIDFYGVDRATKLPLVDVEVPTRLFFWVAPLLTAAIYGYFHLYLIRLWDALGQAPARVGGRALGEQVTPWLVTDAALYLRQRWQQDGSARRRPLEGLAMALNIALAWGFGIVVLYALWATSGVARSEAMMAVSGFALLTAAVFGFASYRVMARRMRGLVFADPMTRRAVWGTWAGGAVCVLALAMLTMAKTGDRFQIFDRAWQAELALYELSGLETVTSEDGTTAPREPEVSNRLLFLNEIDLFGEALVERPNDWLPHAIAKNEFRAVWCDREGVADCKSLSGDQQEAFEAEWTTRRDTQIATLKKPGINRFSYDRWDSEDDSRVKELMLGLAPDLRGADLRGIFAPGLNLAAARLNGAQLQSAQLERANLRLAQMEGAVLRDARMKEAVLWAAQFVGAVLWGAQMEGAVLRDAQMEGADLRLAQMEGADLRLAQMEGADLSFANLKSVEWAGANMRSPAHFSDFRGADGLTQDKLAHVIGNERTLLPPGLHVWTCWTEPAPNLDALAERAALLEDPKDLKNQWLCPEGTAPQPTGTQLGLDETPPWEQQAAPQD